MAIYSLVVPQPIIDQTHAILDLAEKYPIDIPVNECAENVGMGRESLRSCIENGNCPFGFGWKKDGKMNRAFFIPTFDFFWWRMKFVPLDFLEQVVHEREKRKD